MGNQLYKMKTFAGSSLLCLLISAANADTMKKESPIEAM